MAAVVIGALVLTFARFDECRAVHPWWYCL
jgi:hypothetical protein